MAIYRKEEGRLVRGVAVALLFAVALFGAKRLAAWLPHTFTWASGVLVSLPSVGAVTWARVLAGALLAACIGGVWILMNHAKSVDFLIDTESELRKVSWPVDAAQPRFADRYRELWQSSLVVIASVLIMGAMLFVYNLFLTPGVQWMLKGKASV